MPRRILSDAEERQHWKDFEETNAERIKAQEQEYYDNQDFIVVKYPTAEEEELSVREELYELRQLRASYKKRL